MSEMFSKPPILSGRFAASATWQWFRVVAEEGGLVRWVLGKVCPGEGNLERCGRVWEDVSSASYIDVDFDAIAHALMLTIVWSPFQAGTDGDVEAEGKARTIRKAQRDDRVEVGTLQAEHSDSAEELSLGGFLTVIGEDDRPSTLCTHPIHPPIANLHSPGATAFSFPSRHHPLPSTARSSYNATFLHPTGLHPKLHLTLSRRNLQPPRDTCALHAYWTLPSALFIDRYQFSDALSLASQNLVALRSLSGEEDLEAPDWVIERWGSAALFELAHPLAPIDDESDFVVTIPAHLRYLPGPRLPTDLPDQATLEVPWPTVFWACEAEEGLKMSNNPFDRINLGFDGLFGPKTMFYHIPPASGAERLVAEVRVPVLSSESAGYVRFGTALAVLVGFGWVCWKILRGFAAGGEEGREEGERKKVR